MAGRQVGFYWKSDTLTSNIKTFPQKLDRALIAATEYTASRGEADMKRTAPWTDQTSNARNGLFTSTEHSPSLHRIIFGHAVPYGIWLEVRWSGRYQVILPAVRKHGAELMALVGKLFSGPGFK